MSLPFLKYINICAKLFRKPRIFFTVEACVSHTISSCCGDSTYTANHCASRSCDILCVNRSKPSEVELAVISDKKTGTHFPRAGDGGSFPYINACLHHMFSSGTAGKVLLREEGSLSLEENFPCSTLLNMLMKTCVYIRKGTPSRPVNVGSRLLVGITASSTSDGLLRFRTGVAGS